MSYDIATNKSFSGVDMVVTCQLTINGTKEYFVLGSLQTLSYSIHMQRAPIRSIGNVNAKDYVLGPRTIAGSLVFAVFNKHFAYEMMNTITTRHELNSNYAFLADELPPFDVTISFANEYGIQSKMAIYGIRLVNEGQVMSVNDIYTENTYQFVATDIEYLTDENGYSSYQKRKEQARIEGLKNEKPTTTGEDTGKKMRYNKDKDSKDQIISVRVYSVKAASKDSKGVVKITLLPWQTSGKLTIKGESLPSNIEIDVSEYKNETIYLSLNAGAFSAKYDGPTKKIYSYETNFSVASLDEKPPLLQAAPVIEYCSDKKVTVYSNDAKHNKLKFAEIDGSGELEWHEVNLKGRRVTLQDLKEDTTYIIYTFGSKTESMRIYAHTDEFNNAPYEYLKEFVLCNKNSLKYGTYTEYINVIDEAKKIAVADSDSISVSDAIMKYRENIQKTVASLKPSNFNTYADYEKKLKELNDILSICFQLISIRNMTENDNTVYLNPKPVVYPPVPELFDAINCVFLFDKEIKRLEFYRHYYKVTQFAADVDKIAFFDHHSGKKGFRFSGKQGYNYSVYAFDSAGMRSPGTVFYVMTDEEKAKTIGEYNSEKTYVDALLAETERAIGSRLSGLSQDNYNRMLVENAKAMEMNIFPAPTIINSSTEKITVDVSNNESVGVFVPEYYAVIAYVENALYKRVTYKQLITTNTIEFSSRFGGVKPDKMYAIWIENREGTQVSPSITVSTPSIFTDSLLNEEQFIELYRVKDIINQLRLTLGNKINITTEIALAIENLADDESVTYKNVFDKLAFNILSYVPKFVNTDEIIRTIFESKMDILYHIDLNFFSDVKIKNNTITFSPRSQEYMISMCGINHYGISNIPIKVAASEPKNITYDRSSRYLVIFATSSDLYTKSGMIFIDTVTNTVNTYKISIGG